MQNSRAICTRLSGGWITKDQGVKPEGPGIKGLGALFDLFSTLGIDIKWLRTPLDDATIIYTCSTAFSDAFMVRLARRLAALPRARKIVSLQDFTDPPEGFELAEIYKLDASWKRRTKVRVYARV